MNELDRLRDAVWHDGNPWLIGLGHHCVYCGIEHEDPFDDYIETLQCLSSEDDRYRCGVCSAEFKFGDWCPCEGAEPPHNDGCAWAAERDRRNQTAPWAVGDTVIKHTSAPAGEVVWVGPRGMAVLWPGELAPMSYTLGNGLLETFRRPDALDQPVPLPEGSEPLG